MCPPELPTTQPEPRTGQAEAAAEEDPREQILSLRELIEGFRESHRALFRQAREARAERDEAERLFWSLAARGAPLPAEPPGRADPFDELQLEDLPPVTLPTQKQSEERARTLELEEEIRLLNQEMDGIMAANQGLRRQIEAQDSLLQQASLAHAAALKQQLTEVRQEVRQEIRDELERVYLNELVRKDRDAARQAAELAQANDALRRARVDLELAKGRIEESEEEAASAGKKLAAARQTIDELRLQVSRLNRSRTPAPASTPAPAQIPREEIVGLQRAVVRLALGLSRASGSWEPHAPTAARRGFLLGLSSMTISEEDLDAIARGLFPSEEHPSRPSLGDEAAASPRVGPAPAASPSRSTTTMGLGISPPSPPGEAALAEPPLDTPRPSSRQRTMLGVHASAEQIAEQQRLAEQAALRPTADRKGPPKA